MRPLQSVQRRTVFETLEAKKLFAADLMGTAAADLPDTPVVAGFDPGDLVAEFDPGDLVSVEMNPGDAVVELSDPSFPANSLRFIKSSKIVEFSDSSSPVNSLQSARTNFNPREYTIDGAYNFTISPNYVVGGQEGEPIMDLDNCPDHMDHVFEQYAEGTGKLEVLENGVTPCAGSTHGDMPFSIVNLELNPLNGIAHGTQEESTGGGWLASSSNLQEEASQIENMSASPEAPDNVHGFPCDLTSPDYS